MDKQTQNRAGIGAVFGMVGVLLAALLLRKHDHPRPPAPPPVSSTAVSETVEVPPPAPTVTDTVVAPTGTATPDTGGPPPVVTPPPAPETPPEAPPVRPPDVPEPPVHSGPVVPHEEPVSAHAVMFPIGDSILDYPNGTPLILEWEGAWYDVEVQDGKIALPTTSLDITRPYYRFCLIPVGSEEDCPNQNIVQIPAKVLIK